MDFEEGNRTSDACTARSSRPSAGEEPDQSFGSAKKPEVKLYEARPSPSLPSENFHGRPLTRGEPGQTQAAKWLVHGAISCTVVCQ